MQDLNMISFEHYLYISFSLVSMDSSLNIVVGSIPFVLQRFYSSIGHIHRKRRHYNHIINIDKTASWNISIIIAAWSSIHQFFTRVCVGVLLMADQSHLNIVLFNSQNMQTCVSYKANQSAYYVKPNACSGSLSLASSPSLSLYIYAYIYII